MAFSPTVQQVRAQFGEGYAASRLSQLTQRFVLSLPTLPAMENNRLGQGIFPAKPFLLPVQKQRRTPNHYPLDW